MSPHRFSPAILSLLLALAACAGQPLTDPAPLPEVTTTTMPMALPQDALQPWETASPHGTRALSTGTELQSGSQRFLEGGSVADNGLAARLEGQPGAPAWAMYRLPLAGQLPGVVSVDANLQPGAGIMLGLADYATGRWRWSGPYSEGQLRLSVADLPGLRSPSGNLFVVALATPGSVMDLVCVGVDGADPLDGTAPPVPQGLSVQGLPGALRLSWDPVSAPDLAGYRVYWSHASFINPQSAAVHSLPLLTGRTELQLPMEPRRCWLRLASVDISGNLSAASDMLSVLPLPGAPPALRISASAPSAALGDSLSLLLEGAASYDVDTDGNGSWDLPGQSSGGVLLDTPLPGVLRPAVRARDAGGTAEAQAVLSVLISANSRPVAVASADPVSGQAPLSVQFDATQSTDFDGSITGGGWDFDGDGTYDSWSDDDFASLALVSHVYTAPGLYNARLRVTDDAGYWDIDSLAILVTGVDPANQPPQAVLSADRTSTLAPFLIRFDGSASLDPDGSILLYEWDPDGDGSFEESGPTPFCSYSYPLRGNYTALLRVTDNGGRTASVSLPVCLPGPHSMDGLDRHMQRRSPYSGPDSPGLKWQYDAGASVVSASPAIGADGTVYIGSDNGELLALRPDGTRLWGYTVPSWIETTPSIADDGTLLVGCGDGKLYVIGAAGSLRGSFSTGDWITGGTTIDAGGRAYIPSRDGTLRALRPDGSLLWTYPTAGALHAAVALDAAGNIYLPSSDNNLHCLDSIGRLRWSFPAADDLRSSPAIGDDGSIYCTSLDGKLYSLNPQGVANWSYSAGGSIHSAPALAADGTIHFGSTDNYLYAINPDGSLRWRYLSGGDIMADPLVDARGVVYIGSLDNFMHAVSADGELLWSYETGHDVRGNAAIDAQGRLYFGSWDTNIYCLGD
ncbi:MAG: PQQ-binding-like beta-propeller repeat protein [bacterium]